MTLLEAKTRALKLLDESIDKEYRDKLNHFFDIAQKEISTKAGLIQKYETVPSVGRKIALPSDCYEFTGLFDENNSRVSYSRIDDQILTPFDGNFLLRYHAYPEDISEFTPPDYQFSIPQDLHNAMVYYVCALCVIKENDQRPYLTYMDQYNAVCQNANYRKMEMNTITVNQGGVRV